jgi:hypothetical protein
MNIKFQAHQKFEREVEISQQQLFQLFEMMRQEFESHITYGRFTHSYPDALENTIRDFCNSHSVDVEYDKDRISFFKSLLNSLKNPYQ